MGYRFKEKSCDLRLLM